MDDEGGVNKRTPFKKLRDRIFSGREKVTEEEIISVVNEGHESGVIEADEAKMISNIMDFSDKTAKDIMVHRKNIVSLDGDMIFSEALLVVKEEKYSRFPVWSEDTDNVIGMVHIREIFEKSLDHGFYDMKLKEIEDLIIEVDFVPETVSINALFNRMQEKKSHMCMVVDEYGQISGLVAMEDIIEEIVGNIFDEHDEVKQLIRENPDGSFTIAGEAELLDVFEALGITDVESDNDTLNGYLISVIDKIPDDGERFSVKTDGYIFDVTGVSDRMIRLVNARKDHL